MRKIVAIVREDRESDGYWGEVPSLPGRFSQGETMDELVANLREAILLYLETVEEKIEEKTQVMEIAI